MNKEKLTYRQQCLIQLLKMFPNKELTQYEICRYIPDYKWKDDIRNHCCEIWDDVNYINNNSEIPVYIRYVKYKAKLATKEEAMEMIEKKRENALREFNRFWRMKDKFEDQYKIYFDFDEDTMKVVDYFNEVK